MIATPAFFRFVSMIEEIRFFMPFFPPLINSHIL
jgi:hypothetical protein